MTQRPIAIAADDFGLDPQVNAAALVLANLGRISAIGCMVGAPHWQQDAAALRLLDPEKVEVGLHLDLTQHPFDARVRRPLWQWILRTHLHPVSPRGLREEIAAQLDAFADAVGQPPAFVDGHEHIHQMPHVRSLLVQELQARGWRPWLRSTRRPAGLHSIKAWIVESLGAAPLARLAAAHGLRQNRRFVGVYGFQHGGYLERVRAWLAVAQGGDLLVCHPAAGWPLDAPMPEARCHEYAVLASSAFGELLREADVRVAPLAAP